MLDCLVKRSPDSHLAADIKDKGKTLRISILGRKGSDITSILSKKKKKESSHLLHQVQSSFDKNI